MFLRRGLGLAKPTGLEYVELDKIRNFYHPQSLCLSLIRNIRQPIFLNLLHTESGSKKKLIGLFRNTVQSLPPQFTCFNIPLVYQSRTYVRIIQHTTIKCGGWTRHSFYVISNAIWNIFGLFTPTISL